jgi:hypothetical protein
VNRWRWLAGGLALALLAGFGLHRLALTNDADDGLSGAVLPRATAQTKIGVFRGTDPAQVDAYATWLGRDVQYAEDFSARASWQDISDPRYLLAAWKGSPYRLIYGLAMLPTDDRTATMTRGAAGEYDSYFGKLAKRLIVAGQSDAILRLGWEFDLGASRWATDDPQVFISYWRHVVSVMLAQPGARFQFDWSLNAGDNPHDAPRYYPGDDVVDYVGVDLYDISWLPDTYPYPAGCDQPCRLQRQQIVWQKLTYGGPRGLHYWSRFAAQHGKPLSLPEWGLWNRLDHHGGGEDAYYLEQMQKFIADPANDVAYQAYFEVDGADGEHRLMTTFAASGKVFQSLFGG